MYRKVGDAATKLQWWGHRDTYVLYGDLDPLGIRDELYYGCSQTADLAKLKVILVESEGLCPCPTLELQQ